MSETLFEGNYYSGTTAKKTKVSITFELTGLKIESEDNSLFWEFDKIRNTELLSSESVILYYGDFPPQSLEVHSPEFIKRIAVKKEGHNIFEKFYRATVLQKNTVFYILGIIISTLLIGYFFIIPLIMDIAADRFPEDWEKSMGYSLRQSFLFPKDHEAVEIDSVRSICINNFFKEINPDANVDIVVVNSPVKNAFALPGGYIVVYSGIVQSMEGYDELAALLGHEYGHCYYNHSLKSIFRNLSNYILVSAVFGDVSGISAVILENAQSVKQLSYSRELETQADDFGLNIAKKNNISQEGMVKLFTRLRGDTTSSIDIPEFLQTHPKLENRIERIKEKISKENADYYKEQPKLDSLWFRIRY